MLELFSRVPAAHLSELGHAFTGGKRARPFEYGTLEPSLEEYTSGVLL